MPLQPLVSLAAAITGCGACPRLLSHAAAAASTPPRRYRGETYWGRPVPGFGDPRARLLVIGLAPAAHGANRTGRMFTGDASGDWLWEALHRYGFSNRPTSRRRDDDLTLTDAYITAAARCAPPDNKPTATELARCRAYLAQELALLGRVKVVLCLGRIAFGAYTHLLRSEALDAKGLAFAHGAEYTLPGARPRVLLASYHPSRQNTQTRRLSRSMWHSVFARARALLAEAD